jgi:DNA-binding response OmpR family regulator
MSSTAPEGRDSEAGRLGGARADFVASLGRKVADARDLLSVLEDEPASKPPRDELRRRLHALGSGARLLRFDAMARSLQEALVVLERAADAGALREPDLLVVAQTLDDLPALAWGDASTSTKPSPAGATKIEDADELTGRPPVTALVLGPEGLADVLLDDSGTRARSYECERTEDVERALLIARAYAPDLVIVDGDLARAVELVEALLDDPLTEPVPIVVVGAFRAPEEAARFVALGVAKALSKPVPPEILRSVCDEVLDAREERTVRVTLGEPTLEQLAQRLSDELKRALVDGVDRAARSCRVPLGEGTEVFGALWGAIARVQEIVTQRTGGAVRFGGDAPEGAIALAPWLHHELPGAERMAGRGRGAATDVRLNGRRVVVADDDPGVTWFIADLLRTAGCEVHEALDGRSALDVVYRVHPELVVSDILMPGLDGFALSRALRRDVALRGTPVILLSWKEDLLQRVRELGASAAAYMRKESDSRAILARVREVLRPRARIEARLRGEGEVRGRLDELSPRLLLELVGVIRKDARVSVRDASFLYEIDIRAGAPRKATRTASDGSYRSGERALASLLGVGAGRFVVAPASEPVRGDLTGTLAEQLARPIAAARGALAATTGAATMTIERIGVDRDALEEYLRSTPDPARMLIRRIADGASPRQLLLGGDVSPTLLEDVLADMAARGAIRSAEGAGGVDLLSSAIDAALAATRGANRAPSVLPPNARPSAPSLAPALRGMPHDASPRPPAPAPVSTLLAAPQIAATAPYVPPLPSPPPQTMAFALSEPPRRPALDEDPGVPSSLEDAVIRQLSERSPFPGPAISLPPPIVEPSELRPRSSNPPAGDDDGDSKPLPSIPPDAIVPDPAEPLTTEVESHDGASRGATTPSGVDSGAALAPSQAAISPARAPLISAGDGVYTSPFAAPEAPASSPESVEPLEGSAGEIAAGPASPEPAGSAGRRVRPSSAPPARSRARSGWPGVIFLVLSVAAAGGIALYLSQGETPPQPPEPRAEPSASVSEVPRPPIERLAPLASESAVFAVSLADVPAGAEVPAGYGLLEIAAPPGSRLRVDGALVGNGPETRTAVAPGLHELAVEVSGRESRQSVEVRAGKSTRARVASP